MGSNTAATVHTLYLNRENITYSLLGFEKLWLQDFLQMVTFVTKNTQEKSETNQPSWYEVHKEAQNQGQQF